MSTTEALIEAKFLNVCPPTEAVNWLKEKRHTVSKLNIILSDANQLQELVLSARQDPYIDFGLARYGMSERSAVQVYARGDKGIRITYLAHFPNGGFHWMGDGRFNLAVETPKDLDELCALATNPSLSDTMYKDLFTQQNVFASLNEEQFRTLLFAVSSNKRLTTDYDEKTLDGYADYSYHNVFAVAWKLAETVPNTIEWASTLEHLLRNCNLPYGFDPLPILPRWKSGSDTSADQRGTMFYLRARLADALKPDDKLLKAEDPALRHSFYNRFNPRQYPKWPAFVKEGELFLEPALRNKFLWQKAEYRAALRQICWDFPDPESRLDKPSSYNWADDYYRKANPEWFKDEE